MPILLHLEKFDAAKKQNNRGGRKTVISERKKMEYHDNYAKTIVKCRKRNTANAANLQDEWVSGESNFSKKKKRHLFPAQNPNPTKSQTSRPQ